MTTKISKRYKALADKVAQGKAYGIDDALKLVKDGAKAKFNESVDVAIRLLSCLNPPAPKVTTDEAEERG